VSPVPATSVALHSGVALGPVGDVDAALGGAVVLLTGHHPVDGLDRLGA